MDTKVLNNYMEFITILYCLIVLISRKKYSYDFVEKNRRYGHRSPIEILPYFLETNYCALLILIKTICFL